MQDDLGTDVAVASPARRVVSLVPSLTEAIATTRRAALVGATQWCTCPADLEVARVRGTKNPDRGAIEALRPDLVVANQEENRELDVVRLRAAGVPVWVTRIETLDQAFVSLRHLFADALQWEVPSWLPEAERRWSVPAADRGRIAVPVWRDPWMVVGRDTFAGDLLARVGLTNAFADAPERYPYADPAEVEERGVDLVLLPDEPYVFTADDGPEAFPGVPTALVAGRMLTWYGPSLVTARAVLDELAASVPR